MEGNHAVGATLIITVTLLIGESSGRR